MRATSSGGIYRAHSSGPGSAEGPGLEVASGRVDIDIWAGAVEVSREM